MIELGKKREVFWDDYLIDTEKTTASHQIMQPVKKECCFTFDQGNELYGVGYQSIVRDDKGYKLYYSIVRPEEDIPFSPKGRYLAVLESVDGLHWTRPKLDIFPHPELEDNNVVMDAFEDNMFVFYDRNPACPQNEKYKALGRVYRNEGLRDGLWCWTSEDGYHFAISHLVAVGGQFDSLNVAFWENGTYVCYFRNLHSTSRDGEWVEVTDLHEREAFWKQAATEVIRDVRVSYSEDFRNWSAPRLIQFEDGRDDQMYTNHIVPYERAPHLFIGFPTRYVERSEWTENEKQFASYGMKYAAAERLEKREGLAVTDCLFMYSRDGKLWHRFNEAFFTPGYETEYNWIYGDCYPSYNLIDAGEETYYMYCRERGKCMNEPKELYRYEIRKDGFACIMAGGDEQVVVTKPLTFEGKDLHINFSSSAWGYIVVEVLDENGEVLPGAQSFEIYGNNIDRRVGFVDGSDFAGFAGRPIRLRFRMRDARLFSMWFE